MLRSLSSERAPRPPVPRAEKWPKKPKPIGLRRRKSVTQISTEEIVDQIEEYIVHLERTIEDQRVFIKSLLEENRTLKLKQKIRRNIAESKEYPSAITPPNFGRERRNGSAKHSKEVVSDKKNKYHQPGHSYLKKGNDMTLMERLLDSQNIITQPLSRHAPRKRHSNPVLAPVGSSSTGMTHRATYNSEPGRGPSRHSKQSSNRHGGETSRRPAQVGDSAWIRQWLEEEAADDDLWSDY